MSTTYMVSLGQLSPMVQKLFDDVDVTCKASCVHAGHVLLVRCVDNFLDQIVAVRFELGFVLIDNSTACLIVPTQIRLLLDFVQGDGPVLGVVLWPD